MALKKILCIFLQNKAQWLGIRTDSLGHVVTAKQGQLDCLDDAVVFGLVCSPYTSCITAVQATTEVNVFGDITRICQPELMIMPWGSNLLTQMQGLSGPH